MTTTREQILVAQFNSVKTLTPTFQTVTRTQQQYSKLKTFAVTQFPVIAIVGRMPIPGPKVSNRRKALTDTFLTTLKTDYFVYDQQNENQDTRISELVNVLWPKLYEDETWGGLTIKTVVGIDEDLNYWPPFVAFRLTTNVQYQNTIGGI